MSLDNNKEQNIEEQQLTDDTVVFEPVKDTDLGTPVADEAADEVETPAEEATETAEEIPAEDAAEVTAEIPAEDAGEVAGDTAEAVEIVDLTEDVAAWDETAEATEDTEDAAEVAEAAELAGDATEVEEIAEPAEFAEMAGAAVVAADVAEDIYHASAEAGEEKEEKKKESPTLGLVLCGLMILFTLLLLVNYLQKNKDPNNLQPTQTAQAQETETDTVADTWADTVADTVADPVVTEATEAPTEAPTTQVQGQEIPVQLDDGKLAIQSIFQYDGVNPDASGEEGTDIAAIQLINQSSEYLSDAAITVVLADGTILNFQVYDLPANKVIYAFDINNKSIGEDPTIFNSDAVASYLEETGLLDNGVTAEVVSGGIKLTNTSEKNYSDVVVTYHDSMSDILFGGLSYENSIDRLKKGTSETVETEEISFGKAICVKVE